MVSNIVSNKSVCFKRFHVPRLIAMSFAAVLTITFISPVAMAQSFDPLSESEMAKVANISNVKPLLARSALDNSGALKKEVLLIERHQQKGAPSDQRRADVFTYDYETNELIESLVDLNTSQVISTIRKKGVQLPLTENEIKRAKQIIFDDENEREVIAYEYHRITSETLTDTTELNIKAFTFTADSLPNRVNEASKLCGIHRCAQLMLYTGDNIVFEISPIVNLSEGLVTQRIGF